MYYETANPTEPRPGDLWWLPAAWWEEKGVRVLRPEVVPAGTPPNKYKFHHHTEVSSFQPGAQEGVVLPAKRRPCLVLSSLLDIRDHTERVVVLETRDAERLPPTLAGKANSGSIPHVFVLPDDSSFPTLSHRYVDFTRPHGLPRSYFTDSRFKPICRCKPDLVDRILKQYGAWLTRDSSGKS